MAKLYFFSGLFWLDDNQLNGVEYAASESRVSWSNARFACQQDDAALAVVGSVDVDTFLRERFPNASAE